LYYERNMPNSRVITSFWPRTRGWVVAHKVWSGVIALVLMAGAWWMHGKLTSTTGEVRYVLGTVASTTIISSVSASGQVSANNQLDIKPKVSGEVVYLGVKAGQKVKAGTLLMQIDDTDAQKGVRDAEANLQSAQISLQKIQEPADTLSLTQAQNAVVNASSSLATAYTNSINDITSTFLDLPDIITGLQDVVTGTETNRNSQWNIDYYKNAIVNNVSLATTYRDDAFNSYTAARKAYDASIADFKASKLSVHDTASVEKMLNEAYTTTQSFADAIKAENGLIQLYEDSLKSQGQTPNSIADTELTNIASYTTKINSHLSALLADTNSLTSAKQTITTSEQSLQKTMNGADPLDVQSSQLSVTKARNALVDAKNALADYYVRAPFDGTVAAVDVKKFDTASPGSAAATIITSDQLATLSVNEVDAAKIAVGDKATLTFDAIDGLSIAGTVASIDTIGTVAQGVVSYNVKIDFSTQDTRVKSGMTVNASIITETAQDTLAVPSSAVKTQNGSSYVQVFQPPLPQTDSSTGVTSKQTPVNIAVTTGISDDANVQILSGLSLGQQIVVRTTTGTPAAATTRTTTGGATRGNAGFGGGVRLGG